MIFANHAHVFPKELRPEGSVDSLMRLMDDCGIEKAVAFAILPRSGLEKSAQMGRLFR